MEYIAAFSAALALAEKLAPKIQELFNRGEITFEQQQDLQNRYNRLKAVADGQFTGPEWKEA